MKTSRRLVRKLSVVAGGLLICLPASFAAPGSGPAFGTVSANTTAGRTAPAGPAVATRASGAAVGVNRSATRAGNNGFRPSTNATAGFRPRIGSNGTGTARLSGGNYRQANPFVGPRAGNVQTVTAPTRLSIPIVNNAWTDPNNTRVAGANAASRAGKFATSSQRNGLAANPQTGNHLYPGTYGYAPNRPASGHFDHGDHGRNKGNGPRLHRRYYYNNFPYAVYYPYLYNNYGYGGYGNFGYYGGTTDYAGLTAGNGTTDLGAPDFTTTPNNYYRYVDPGQDTPSTDESALAQPLPDAPAVGPQSPSAADQSAGAPQGPDSLVEAVQTELARRGYLEGKADSMYTPATKEAIRRFQTDQRLPATGRINEATLHALNLG